MRGWQCSVCTPSLPRVGWVALMKVCAVWKAHGKPALRRCSGQASRSSTEDSGTLPSPPQGAPVLEGKALSCLPLMLLSCDVCMGGEG